MQINSNYKFLKTMYVLNTFSLPFKEWITLSQNFATLAVEFGLKFYVGNGWVWPYKIKGKTGVPTHL